MEEKVFRSLLQEKTAAIDELLRAYLPEEAGYQKTVLEAMNYSILAGGKRLRPMLMKETFLMCGGSGEQIEPFMAAIEMIHTYSLVHDDLPSMDNDEYRRGCRTTWAVYGDAFGILAGDGLLNYAFETAFRAFPAVEEGAAFHTEDAAWPRVALSLSVLAQKAGVFGMIGGQTADIEGEKCQSQIDTDRLLFIHEHKTAALIQASMMIGAILAGASPTRISELERCGYNLGVAFQIQDDILDVTGDSRELGKATGSDESNHKQTYVTINGLEKSAADVKRLSEQALNIIKGFEGDHAFLEQLILHLVHRRS